MNRFFVNSTLRTFLRSPNYRKNAIVSINQLRLISTSDKGGPKSSGGDHHDRHLPPSDPNLMGGNTDIYVGEGVGKAPPGPKTVEDFKNLDSQKNWISYGFDYVFKDEDRYQMNYYFFMAISLFIWGYGFCFMYMPDVKLQAWAEREAYLEMARRKKLGGPYISRDYVNPKNINLPTDEELGDFEIIV